jgi:hypothetical protein
MIKDFEKPIKCPNCHNLLTVVQLQITKVIEWEEENDDDEGEFADNGQGSRRIFCPNCSKEIGHYDANSEWGVFPEFDC